MLALTLGIPLAGAVTASAGTVQAPAVSGDFAGLVDIGGCCLAKEQQTPSTIVLWFFRQAFLGQRSMVTSS
jgi:hypothetical protein